MLNLDQAQQNVRNAQNQLDQALKELEKAKKTKVWEAECPNGCRVSFSKSHDFHVDRWEDGPCKVTVRPLGGPEPVVEECAVGYLPYILKERMMQMGCHGDTLVKVSMEVVPE